MSTRVLPEDSLDRLSALAAVALFGSPKATQSDELRAAVVSLELPMRDGAVTCGDVAAPGTGTAPAPLPRGTRAWALLPLGDTEPPPRRERELWNASRDAPAEAPLALLVTCARPRLWSTADSEALAVVAMAAAAELQLRQDLDRQLRIAEETRANPLHDPVTELANRELFLDRVEMALLRTFRHPDRRFAVMSLSLVQFHDIETTFGYDAAREVLKEFAVRLRTAVRNYDSIARIAGDEFGILLESIRDDSDAARVANRVHEFLRSPIDTRWAPFMVSANVGIVLSHSGADSANRLLQLAGLARARVQGSSAPYEIYDPLMQEHAQNRLHKEMELRRAVELGEFELYYQPIVSMATGRIVQTEALVRWRHPRRGIVTAADFIGLAEDTGLAVPMGWFTLNRACGQLTAWRETLSTIGPLSMSINVTAAHFHQRDVAQRFGEILGKAGVTQGVTLEVTERLLIRDPANARSVLTTLRELGLAIHLDDFGTGYSSLQYLHELPFDAIKIDRGFIARMGNGGRDAQIVSTIRELARQLGVPVIAEGVETAEHLALVRDLGCEFAQGYFFCRPLPATETTALLMANPQW